MAKDQTSYPADFDAFTFSEGFDTEFDGLVIDSYFEVDNSYKEGALLMHWRVQNLESGEELKYPLKFSCGEGWVTKDDGKTAQKENTLIFNKNSVYGLVCIKCLTELNMVKTLEARFDKRGLGFREAKGWKGLKFHFEPVAREYKGLDEKANRPKIMPVKFLGSGSSKSNASATNKEAPKGENAAEKAKRLAAEKKAAKARETLEGKLTEMAREAEDFDSFIAAAFELDEVIADEELQTKLADPDEFFASARAEE